MVRRAVINIREGFPGRQFVLSLDVKEVIYVLSVEWVLGDYFRK